MKFIFDLEQSMSDTGVIFSTCFYSCVMEPLDILDKPKDLNLLEISNDVKASQFIASDNSSISSFWVKINESTNGGNNVVFSTNKLDL